MKHVLTEQVREPGYEVLFLVGGYQAGLVSPVMWNLDEMFRWEGSVQAWRMHLKRLKGKGLIAGELGKGRWEGRITELGRTVFAGGRQPERSWGRAWDGRWRLVSFDLSRGQSAERMKLRRWLVAQRFGHLPGSVWVSPDPVRDIGAVTVAAGVDAAAVMVFEGNLAGSPAGRDVAAMGWDFEVINAAHRQYVEAAGQWLQQLRKSAPGRDQVRKILRADRKAWLRAVDRDPLLPRELLPVGYEGPAAWEARGRLMEELGRLMAPA